MISGVARNETFDLAGPAGRLEAIILHPDADPVAAAVVCHAHPLHGGMMHFKTVYRTAKALQSAGVAALRFNFRGVGHSDGKHDHGAGEQADVSAGLDELGRRFPDLPLLSGGFSFGAVVGFLAGRHDLRVRGLFLLGYPLRSLPRVDLLHRPDVACLFVQGDNDEFGPGEALDRLVAPLPGLNEIAIIAECNHFFDGHLDVLEESVAEWADARPWEAP